MATTHSDPKIPTGESRTSARSYAAALVDRAAMASGLDAAEVGPDSWVLRFNGQPPAVGPMSLGEMVFFVLEDLVVHWELEMFGEAIDPSPGPSMLEHMIEGAERERQAERERDVSGNQ